MNRKMKRYQEGGSTSVEVEKKSSILDDIGLKGLPLGLVGQGLISALEKNDLGGMGALGLVGKLMERKKKREMGMPGTPEDSITKIEIEKSKGMGDDMMGGGPIGYKKGGRIDGCAIKGKTKGTYR
jgi:hypothetical protein